MKVELFNGDRSAWDRYVILSPHSTIYHQYGWRDIIESSFKHKTYYLAATNNVRQITGVLPLVHIKSMLFGNVLVSMPFLNYGGILADDDAARQAILKYAEGMLHDLGANYIELRHIEKQELAIKTKLHKVGMIMELHSDIDAQWKSFGPKLRNQIRKAQKSGLTFKIGGLNLLDGFYDVFSRNMRDLGTPVYPKDKFRNILKIFPDNSRLLSIFVKDKVIASALVCSYKDMVEVPSASAIREYRSLCPGNLMYWAAIQFAIQNGFKRFDFGRSTPGEGTYKFKEQWGAQPVQLHWQYIMRHEKPFPELNPKNLKFRMAINIWKKLPVGLTRVIGPPIVRNIP